MGIKRDLIAHLTQKQVEDYCRKRLGVAELLRVSDHLGECEACRRQVEYAMNGDAAFFALRSELFDEAADIASPHLTEEQMAGYVDKNLSGLEHQTIADHLAGCEQCALAVDDLAAFRHQIAPSLEREYHPAPVPSLTEGWLHRTAAYLFAPFRSSSVLAFSAVIAVLFLAGTGWLILRTPQEIEPKQEIAIVPAPTFEPAPPSEPTSAPAVVAQLSDGEGRLTLDQEGKLSGADDLPMAYQSMMREAITARRIGRSSQLKGLSRPPSSLMSADNQGNEFSLIEPVGKVLMSDRPTFRWSPMEGATVYVVEVYDSKFNLVAASPELASRSWSPPALSRGKTYAWQVKAIKDGQEFTSPRPPAPQAGFRIIDQAKANELAKARRAFPSSHLTLGLLYAEAGLLNEAEQEMRALQRANPDSELARSLLIQVQALRRRSE